MIRLPRWSRRLIVAAAVLVAVAAALPRLLGAERHRADLLAAIESATGGQASLGSIRLHVLPTAGFSVDHLVVRERSGDSTGAKLSIDTVRGRLAWRSLWSGALIVTAVDVAGVTVEWPGLAPINIAVSHVELDGPSVRADLSAAFGQVARVKARVTVDDWDQPVARFELTMPLLDLGALASIRSVPPPHVDGSPGPATPSTLIAVGRVRADLVRLPPLQGTAAEAAVRVFTDHLEIAPVSMAFYDGTLGVTMRVDRTVRPARFSAALDVRDASLALVLAAFDAQGPMTGTAAGAVRLNGSFGETLVDSLNGEGTLTIRNGTLPGYDGKGMMGTVAKMQDAVTFGAGTAQYGKEIPFQSFAGDITVDARQIHSQRLRLESVVGTVNLRGSTGFDQRINYEGLAALIRGRRPGDGDFTDTVRDATGAVVNLVVGRVRIPFSVRGTLATPKVGPGVRIQAPE